MRGRRKTGGSLSRQLMDMYFLDNINLPLKLHLICYMLHKSISPLLPFPMLLTFYFNLPLNISYPAEASSSMLNLGKCRFKKGR